MSVWSEHLRPKLASVPQLKAAKRSARHWVDRHWPTRSFDQLRPRQALRVAYNVLLQREPEPQGWDSHLAELLAGVRTYTDLINDMRGSDEFQSHVRMTGRSIGASLHASRCHFVRTFPRARRLLDLGGTHLNSERGALVELGYPYHFDELIIIDLPPDERHALYQEEVRRTEVDTEFGPVRYRYHSMTSYADASFDLVYSGQSIEHVTEEEADLVLKQVHRILRPGGYLGLDTPNARVTRLQQEEFIDPDHKIEYTHDAMLDKFERAGFRIVDAKGLNYAGISLSRGEWDPDEVAGNLGLFSEIEDCYVLAYVVQKPEA
jgi:SAM-dependent methyltransferase